MTNELTCKDFACKNIECKGHWIEEFISCGPKIYTFRLITGEIVCKVRGFCLNHRSSLIINFQTMQKALFAWMKKEPVELVTVKTELVREKYDPKIVNRTVSKNIQCSL